MTTIIWIITANVFVSLLSLSGIITLGLKQKLLDKLISYLVALAAGTMLGAALFHLVPESLEYLPARDVMRNIILAYVLFLFIEIVLRWRHCHKAHCEVHSFAYMNLLGDALHNFIDGLVIGATFTTNIQLGIMTSFAIALHELPQEIGDFGVLVHFGFNMKKALIMNLMTALTAVLGGIIAFFLSSQSESIALNLLPFASGGFIYIAASDLIPYVKEEENIQKSILYILIIIMGILLINLLA